MSHPNESLLRECFAAFARRDLSALGELLTDDIVWVTPGRNLLAGEFRGRASVLAYLERALALSADTLDVVPEDILANDERGVAVLRVSGERGGRILDDRTVQLFEFRDGKVSGRWLYPADARAVDLFWSD